MPYRVRNTKTGHVYTVGIVSDDETDITSDENPATDTGGNYVPALYGDEAAAATATPKKKTGAN